MNGPSFTNGRSFLLSDPRGFGSMPGNLITLKRFKNRLVEATIWRLHGKARTSLKG